jgi:hypothetical protein
MLRSGSRFAPSNNGSSKPPRESPRAASEGRAADRPGRNRLPDTHGYPERQSCVCAPVAEDLPCCGVLEYVPTASNIGGQSEKLQRRAKERMPLEAFLHLLLAPNMFPATIRIITGSRLHASVFRTGST